MPFGRGYKPMLRKLRILRCPAQWEGNPISECSSKTVTLTPSLAKFSAAYEPTGPPPIITASGVLPVEWTVWVIIVILLD